MLNRKLNEARRSGRSRSRSISAESEFKYSPVARAINQTRSLPKLCALTALTISSPLFAQSFPAVINLSDLDGSNGFVITVDNFSFSSESSVSTAGDFNGDGITDIIIGVPYVYYPRRSGEAYVVFGREDVGSTGALNLTGLNGDNGFLISGGSDTPGFGYSVSDSGDFNGDGVSDVIIGDQNDYAGNSYVVFGGVDVGSAGVLSLSAVRDGTNGFEINGIGWFDYFGASVSSAGDINGDGVSGVIILSPFADPAGESYIVFGSGGVGNSNPLAVETLDGSNGFVIKGIDDGDSSGRDVSDAGDFNGDGVADVIIGASGGDGESYIVFGGAGVGNSGSLELSSLVQEFPAVINLSNLI